MSHERPASRNEFEIAIICTLKSECDALALVFDDLWDDSYGKADGDHNHYTTGRVGRHNAILTRLPFIGKVEASRVTSSLRSSYVNVRLALLVGVCGGQPYSPENEEIVLGDVIISKHVIQYDLGRQYPNGFRIKDGNEDTLGRPNADISGMLALIETDHGRDRMEKRTRFYLDEIKSKRTRKPGRYIYPGSLRDKLFEATYRHKHHGTPTCICRNCFSDLDPVCEAALEASCASLECHEKYLVMRQKLAVLTEPGQEMANPAQEQPTVHVGVFASGDKVIKSAAYRDEISNTTGAIGFEMEAAGVWGQLPCVVIKGVSDYADSHKEKIWQDFAAATAASAAKALLELHVHTGKPAAVSGHHHKHSDTTMVANKMHSSITAPSPPTLSSVKQTHRAQERLIMENAHVGNNGKQVGISKGEVFASNITGKDGALQLFGYIPDTALVSILNPSNMPNRNQAPPKREPEEQYDLSQSGGGGSPTR